MRNHFSTKPTYSYYSRYRYCIYQWVELGGRGKFTRVTTQQSQAGPVYIEATVIVLIWTDKI